MCRVPARVLVAGKVVVVTGGASGHRRRRRAPRSATRAPTSWSATSPTTPHRASVDALGASSCAPTSPTRTRSRRCSTPPSRCTAGSTSLVNNAGSGLHGACRSPRSPRRGCCGCSASTPSACCYGTKHAARVMTDGGAIVNVGSLASDLAWADNGAYAVSKAGVLALTRTAAVELAPRGHPGQRGAPVDDRDADDRARHRRAARRARVRARASSPQAPDRHGRRGRGRRALPGVRRLRLPHRPGAHDRRRPHRRPVADVPRRLA